MKVKAVINHKMSRDHQYTPTYENNRGTYKSDDKYQQRVIDAKLLYNAYRLLPPNRNDHFSLYRLYFKTKPEEIYYGVTGRSLKIRLEQHIRDNQIALKRKCINYKIQEGIRKYGSDDLCIEIENGIENVSEVLAYSCEFIYAPLRNVGLNIMQGGGRIAKHGIRKPFDPITSDRKKKDPIIVKAKRALKKYKNRFNVKKVQSLRAKDKMRSEITARNILLHNMTSDERKTYHDYDKAKLQALHRAAYPCRYPLKK